MTGRSPRVCPACRRPARNSPLPPEGFWQVQVLQRIGMYPYRCLDCDARYYRKVPIGRGLGEARYPIQEPDLVPQGRPEPSPDEAPKILVPPDVDGDGLSHEDFVDLIDHISRSEQRKGLKASENTDKDKGK